MHVCVRNSSWCPKVSSALFRHSRMSMPSSFDNTRIVAVLAVPAGPVKASIRCFVVSATAYKPMEQK